MVPPVEVSFFFGSLSAALYRFHCDDALSRRTDLLLGQDMGVFDMNNFVKYLRYMQVKLTKSNIQLSTYACTNECFTSDWTLILA